MELLSDPIIIEDELPFKKNIGVLGGLGGPDGSGGLNYLWIAIFILIIIVAIWKFNSTKIEDISNIKSRRFDFEE